MSILIKAGAGLVAGAVAGALGLAFMPQGATTAVAPRQAVGKPQFVAAVAPSSQAAPAVSVAARPMAAVAAKPLPAKPLPATPPSPQVAAVAPEIKAPQPPASAMAETRAVATNPVPTPAPVVTAAAAPVATAPAAGVNDEAARWSVRGLVALAKGDLSSARLFLTRAAEAGDPRAWIALADTYDPAMLTRLGVVGAPGDAQRAKDYLLKAAAAGLIVPKDRTAALDQTPATVH